VGNLHTVSGLSCSWVLVSPFMSISATSSSAKSGSGSCSIVSVSDKLDSSSPDCLYINQHVRIFAMYAGGIRVVSFLST
jgi:hypothetical protein